VRRWDTGDSDATVSLWLEVGLIVEDAVVDNADCLAADGGGAGAMGHRRLELGGGSGDEVAAAQLTTMIAVGADVSGTNMPPTLVRTTGTETGLVVACPAAMFVTAAVDGGNMSLVDEAR